MADVTDPCAECGFTYNLKRYSAMCSPGLPTTTGIAQWSTTIRKHTTGRCGGSRCTPRMMHSTTSSTFVARCNGAALTLSRVEGVAVGGDTRGDAERRDFQF